MFSSYFFGVCLFNGTIYDLWMLFDIDIWRIEVSEDSQMRRVTVMELWWRVCVCVRVCV